MKINDIFEEDYNYHFSEIDLDSNPDSSPSDLCYNLESMPENSLEFTFPNNELSEYSQSCQIHKPQSDEKLDTKVFVNFEILGETNKKNNIKKDSKSRETKTKSTSEKIFEFKKVKKATTSTTTTTAKSETTEKNEENKDKDRDTKGKPKQILGHKRTSDTPKITKKKISLRRDNITKKMLPKIFDKFLSLINDSLKDPNKKYQTIFLKKITQNIIGNIKVENIKELLTSKLKDIFSNEISNKLKNFEKDSNKILIDKIYKEKIKTKTISILERNFLECIEHFRGSQKFPELNGLEKQYPKVIQELEEKGETEEYIEEFKNIIGKFEIIYLNKKGRNRKKGN